jgi:hypothetical protein
LKPLPGSKNPAPPVNLIFLTVQEDRDFLEAAFSVGGLGYVLKPRLATDLIPAIRVDRGAGKAPQAGGGGAGKKVCECNRLWLLKNSRFQKSGLISGIENV